MDRAIGIDLGTTFTVVAAVEDGRPVVLPNAEGQHLTPSVVAFRDDGKVLVGETARAQAAANAENTVFSIKRRMGSAGKVKACGRYHSPEEISGFILHKVKADAEQYLGETISRAVITVPAYFNDRQRSATKEAGAIAGFDVMRIINEPTAAALAYGLEREDVRTVMVWDLGGGTFDVSILELGEGIFEVRAVSGDTWLGGDDFDRRLVEWLTRRYTSLTGRDFPPDAGLGYRMWEVAEKAKRELSDVEQTRVLLPLLGPDGEELMVEVTRQELEGQTADLLDRMAVATRQSLSDARLEVPDIERVILVGGSSRMPAVRRLAKDLLGREPYRYVDTDEVVAMGAAVQSGILLGLLDKVVLLDVLPLSLGVETQGGLMSVIIPRNTPVPASGSRIFTTAADYQSSMDIHVLQGERQMVADNISLETVGLSDIVQALRGVSKVEVCFDVDVDGIIHLSASDLLSGNQVQATVVSTKVLDPREIQKLAEEARRSAAQDKEKRDSARVGIEARNTLDAARAAIDELPQTAAASIVQEVTDAIARVEHAMATGSSVDMKSRAAELRRLLVNLNGRSAPASIDTSVRPPPKHTPSGDICSIICYDKTSDIAYHHEAR